MDGGLLSALLNCMTRSAIVLDFVFQVVAAIPDELMGHKAAILVVWNAMISNLD